MDIFYSNMYKQVIRFINALHSLWKILFRSKSPLDPPDLSQKVPLLGHTPLLLGSSKALLNNLQQASKECMEKGGVVTAYFAFHTVYFVTDPEDCLVISNACLGKGFFYKILEPFLGNSILNSDVATWKVHRKLLNPAFNQTLLNSFMDIFNNQARRLADQLKVEIGTSCDVDQYLRLNALETICMTSLGTDLEGCSLQRQYIKSLKEVLEIIVERLQKFWLLQDWVYNISALKKREKEVTDKLNRFSIEVIKQKKKEMQTTSFDESKHTSGKIKPFLELILEIANVSGSFTEDEVRMETNAIIAAGHDTSATVLTYTLLLLGSHPEVQKKVYEEILQVFGNTDREVEKDDLAKLVYIEAVLKESMRLYPVAPAVARYVDKDVRLKNYILKAHSSCVLSVWGIHRHPMWGPDPEQFRPERWLEATIPNGKYLGAFMVGNRSCIGKLYAMMSMKTSLTHVVRRYQIHADISKLKLKLDLMLKPESGRLITLKLRE